MNKKTLFSFTLLFLFFTQLILYWITYHDFGNALYCAVVGTNLAFLCMITIAIGIFTNPYVWAIYFYRKYRNLKKKQS